jgi:hypothetical protein
MARRSLLRLPLARQRAGNRLAAVECYHDVFAAVVGHDHGRNDRPRPAPSTLSAFATNSRSNDGLAIALVALASSLTILCTRLFSRSLARRVSRVLRAIGFRGSTMSHSFKKNVQTTRRILLQTAIGAVSAVSFLGLTARGARAAKSSKSDVVYQDSPKGNQQCDGCRQFIPPNACKQVEGVISPSGWCKMWAKKAG